MKNNAFTLAEVFYPAEQSRKIAVRIIRDLAGVTSGSTRRAGFAFAHTAPYRKFGFTLAEVLITLGIIGVVAALTMPSLIQSYKKQEASARLKKFYSMMSQAILLSETDNGQIDDWTMVDWTKTDDGEYDYETNGKVSKAFFYKYLAKYIQYTKFEEAETFEDKEGKHPTIYLNEGTTFSIMNSGCMDITFDVNGHKPPNEYGRDVYVFLICPNKYLRLLWCNNSNGNAFCSYDFRHEHKSREQLLQNCKNTPYTCSGLLEHDNWIFKSDYPHKL